MPMPPDSVVAAAAAAELGNSDPDSLAALTVLVKHILLAVRAGTITVPSIGLVSPPGVAGGPVVGVAVGTIT